MDICILQYNIYEILSICVYTNRFVGSATCLPMRREHAHPRIKQSPRSTHGFFPQLHILITLRSLSAQPHRQNWQNCVRGPSLELGGRTPQVAGLTRTGWARVWSLRGTSWVQANHRTEGGGVICFRFVALSGLESTSEANICSRGTIWDVTDKHDMSRWLAGLGMFGNWRWKPSNLYAEWMLQMTSQSNPWDPSLGSRTLTNTARKFEMKCEPVKLSRHTHTRNLSFLQDQFKFRANFHAGMCLLFVCPSIVPAMKAVLSLLFLLILSQQVGHLFCYRPGIK